MTIYGIAIDAFYGTRQKRAYECDHEGDGFFPIADNATAAYVKGYTKPNYPMPAIRYDVAILSEGIACINRTQSTVDMVITKLHHIVYDI